MSYSRKLRQARTMLAELNWRRYLLLMTSAVSLYPVLRINCSLRLSLVETTQLITPTAFAEDVVLFVENKIVSVSEDEDRRKTVSVNEDDDRLAVFYTVFTASNEGKVAAERTLSILAEQIEQIGESYAVQSLQQHTYLYYSLIGSRLVEEGHIQELCAPYRDRLTCSLLQHVDEGSEVVTLKSLFSYCEQHPNHRVAYEHTKGAFHPSTAQNYMRRHGTIAALSKDCARPPNDACNACSLLWTMFPLIHNSGNFWTAKCSYIRQLIPPQDLDSRSRLWLRERLHPLIHSGLVQSSNVHPIYQAKHSPETGIGRYAAEMWIGSHPSLVPCDLSDTAEIGEWRATNRTIADFKFGMAPRRDIHEQFLAYRKWGRPNLGSAGRISREFLFMPGLILRYQQLYNETPPHDSWVWSFFPDGEVWREGLRQHGNRTVEALLSNL